MNTRNWRRWATKAVLAALLAAPAAYAQSAPAPQGPLGGQRRGQQLSTEQKTRMKEIRKSTQDQIRAVRNDPSLTPEQKRDRVREINQNSNQQAKSILSPDQYRRYERRVQDRQHDRRQDRRDHRRGNRPPRVPRS